MMKSKILYTIAIVGLIFSYISCEKVPVGYLNTDEASFPKDTVTVYRNIDPNSKRAINNAPWTSLQIQGVAGTNPINYKFHSVKVADGGNEEKFIQLLDTKELVVRGGIVFLFQSGVAKIPNGNYTISLTAYNEGYSQNLENILTFVVQDDEL